MLFMFRLLSSVRNFSSGFYVISSYLNIVIGIVTSIILANTLGLYQFGVYIIYVNLFTVLIPLCNFKFDEVLMKYFSVNDEFSIKRLILLEYFVLTTILLLISYFYDLVLGLFNVQVPILSYMIVYACFLCYWPTSIDGLIRHRNLEKKLQFIKVGSSSLGFLLILLIIFLGSMSASLALGVMIVSRALVAIFMWGLFLSSGQNGLMNEIYDEKAVLREASWAASSVYISIPTKSVSVLAGLFLTPSAVGILKIADGLSLLSYQSATSLYRLNFSNVMGSALQGASNVMLPRVLVGAITLFYVIFLPYILPLVYGEEFSAAFWPTIILCLAYFYASFVYLAPAQVLKIRGQKFSFFVKFWFSFLVIPLAYFGAIGYGVIGLTIGIGLAKCGIMLFYSMSLRGEKYAIRN